MNVALINPKGTIFSNNMNMTGFLQQSIAMGSFRHFWSAPCLGLLSIASYLPGNCNVTYIDENYQQINFNVHYDFVCISAMTVQAVRAYEIAGRFKELGVLTVMGGIHATILPYEALDNVDVVLAGEGEVLFPVFLKDFLCGKQKSLYKEIEQGTFALSNCVAPQYMLIKNYEYPIINLYTTRGCPRKCNFCCASNVYGPKYRRKLNKQILEEIDLILDLYPDKLLLFADDNLFVKRKESKELLKELKKKKVRWIAQTDITVANDEELLKLMYESGCQWIVIGFESVSKKNKLFIENKDFKIMYQDNYGSCIKKIQSFGIKIYGTFIVGLDGDKKDIFDLTADFILNNHLYGANITVPTPLPGTNLRKQLDQEDRILSSKWSDYTLWDVIIKPKNMSVLELEEGLLKIYKKISAQTATDDRLRAFIKNIRNEYKQNSKQKK